MCLQPDKGHAKGDFRQRAVPDHEKANFKQVTDKACVKGDLMQKRAPDQDKCAFKELGEVPCEG